MRSPSELVHQMRIAAGLSQRALARKAGTSQPAVARYERAATMPSWETLQRLAEACGWQIRLEAEAAADPHDIALAERFLDLTPQQRLRAVSSFARLRDRIEET